MKKIIALGGSNSKASINKQLATYAANQVKEAEVRVLDLNDFDLPMFGIDLEREQGIPEAAKQLQQEIDGADGLVISLAEHNGSYSAAFKNAFDWLSRIEISVWKDIPMLLMATSPGRRGGLGVLEAAMDRFPRQGGNIVSHFSLPSFNDNFTPEGIADATLRQEFEEKMNQFETAL